MPHNFDVVCVGNAKIDSFLTLHDATNNLRFIEETNELCIKFGEKIAVDKAEFLVGGNAANVSVGFSRMGLNTGLVAELGGDEFAQKILSVLKKENVDTSNILQSPEQQSSFSTIINFKSERTIFSEHVKREHNFNFENISAKWIYLTSIGEAWENAYDKTVEFVKRTNSLLAFNPGTLQLANGAKELTNVLSSSSVLIVNKEEAETLLMINDKGPASPQGGLMINDLLKKLKELGPKIVVITDGKNGSRAIDESGKITEQGIIEAEVIEKTGAGDAYSCGFLGALLHEKSIKEAMVWGAKNSSSVITKVGAQRGLLYRKDLT